jgi:N-acetylmuramoyl-L-alanine amidase
LKRNQKKTKTRPNGPKFPVTDREVKHRVQKSLLMPKSSALTASRYKSSRILRWGVATLVLLAVAASPCVGASRIPPSFSDSYKKLERLSKDPSATREQWLDVINAFVVIHVSGKPNSVARRSLFRAGKACLSLYRISGKPEDLDLAIRYLTDFHRDCRKGPYFIPTLQALKEAHILKRKLEAKNQCDSIPATRPKAVPTSPTEPPKTADLQDHGIRTDVALEARGLPIAPENSDKVQYEQKNNPRDWNGNASSHGNPYAQGPPATPKKSPAANQVASLPPTATTDAIPAAPKAKCPAKTFVVVIDPGHGGKDPGAVSTDGSLKEKDITLDVAKRFKTALESKSRNVRVTLTREDDRSLSLQERTAIANSLNADLFVSVHCNADVDASSKGIETFFLDKANSPRAMKVAARENGIPLSKMSDLEATLLDLMMTSKKSESTELAKTIHEALARGLERSKFSVRNRGVKQAPFYVLLGAQMPAILVECAFISSSRALRTLTSPQYLGSVAEGLANGAALYLRGLGQEG